MSGKKDPEKPTKVGRDSLRKPHSGKGTSTRSQQPATKLQAKPKKPKA